MLDMKGGKKMPRGEYMVIKIFANGHIEVENDKGERVEPDEHVNSNDVPGPINTYHQGLWYSGSPICFWHGGKRYCINR
jgi:hypothetical protein